MITSNVRDSYFCIRFCISKLQVVTQTVVADKTKNVYYILHFENSSAMTIWVATCEFEMQHVVQMLRLV